MNDKEPTPEGAQDAAAQAVAALSSFYAYCKYIREDTGILLTKKDIQFIMSLYIKGTPVVSTVKQLKERIK